MNNIEELHDIYVRANFGLSQWKDCVSWALDRLLNDEEGDDNNIILLASSNDEKEIKELTKKILPAYLSDDMLNEEYRTGMYVVQLHKKFHANRIDIFELETILHKLYYNLDYPNWLVMLSRNCEYATDIPNFEQPFKDEFEYIVGLWGNCDSLKAFNEVYDRNISNSHDWDGNK